MKRALFVVVPVALLLALYAWAGPRPRAAVRVFGSVTVASHSVADLETRTWSTGGVPVLLQCPGGIVWYRTLTAAELAAGGLVSPGLGMTDGGGFGVLVDFTSQGDPVSIPMSSNDVIALLGTDAGLVTWGQTDGGTNQDAGFVTCFVSVP